MWTHLFFSSFQSIVQRCHHHLYVTRVVKATSEVLISNFQILLQFLRSIPKEYQYSKQTYILGESCERNYLAHFLDITYSTPYLFRFASFPIFFFKNDIELLITWSELILKNQTGRRKISIIFSLCLISTSLSNIVMITIHNTNVMYIIQMLLWNIIVVFIAMISSSIVLLLCLPVVLLCSIELLE